jgi:hypothetical protein
MARRLIKHVKLAAAVALLLDGGEDALRRRESDAAAVRPRYVNELALARAVEQREEMLARTTEALQIAKAAAGVPAERRPRRRG